MKLSRTLLAGATGAAMAYFLDPQQGRRRRSMALDRAGHVIRRARRVAARNGEYLGGKLRGVPAKLASFVRPAPVYDDVTLAEKVKTELFADPRYDGKINVSAQNGVVVLVGQIEDPDEVVARVKRVKGVGPVINLMHRPGTPAPHMV